MDEKFFSIDKIKMILRDDDRIKYILSEKYDSSLNEPSLIWHLMDCISDYCKNHPYDNELLKDGYFTYFTNGVVADILEERFKNKNDNSAEAECFEEKKLVALQSLPIQVAMSFYSNRKIQEMLLQLNFKDVYNATVELDRSTQAMLFASYSEMYISDTEEFMNLDAKSRFFADKIEYARSDGLIADIDFYTKEKKNVDEKLELLEKRLEKIKGAVKTISTFLQFRSDSTNLTFEETNRIEGNFITKENRSQVLNELQVKLDDAKRIGNQALFNEIRNKMISIIRACPIDPTQEQWEQMNDEEKMLYHITKYKESELQQDEEAMNYHKSNYYMLVDNDTSSRGFR